MTATGNHPKAQYGLTGDDSSGGGGGGRWWVPVTAALIALAVGLGALEFAAGALERSRKFFRGPYKVWHLPQDLGFPQGSPVRHLGQVTPLNAGGYTGPHYPPRPRAGLPGVWRVAVLGDSMTFGFGVRPDEAWPAALERQLNETPVSGTRIEVLNFGVPGYNTYLEKRLYEEKVRAYHPDVVLVGWFGNDAILDRHDPNFWAVCEEPAPLWQRALGRAVETSNLVRVLHDLATWYGFAYPGVQEDYGLAMSPRHFGFRCAIGWLGALDAAVRADGAQTAVVQIPYFALTKREPNQEIEGQRRVAEALRGLGIPQVNLVDELVPATASEPLHTMMLEDTHPTAEGHALLARAMAAHRADLRLVPAAAQPNPVK